MYYCVCIMNAFRICNMKFFTTLLPNKKESSRRPMLEKVASQRPVERGSSRERIF